VCGSSCCAHTKSHDLNDDRTGQEKNPPATPAGDVENRRISSLELVVVNVKALIATAPLTQSVGRFAR